MLEVFADTAGWANFFIRTEPFHTQAVQFWSLVDCSSMIVMQRRNITTVFTTDHHFEQAGFIKALK